MNYVVFVYLKLLITCTQIHGLCILNTFTASWGDENK